MEGRHGITDSKSCPMLITWETEGEEGIFGMKRERSATDASLVTSSSTNEFVGISCSRTVIAAIRFHHIMHACEPRDKRLPSCSQAPIKKLKFRWNTIVLIYVIPRRRRVTPWNGKPFDCGPQVLTVDHI